MYSRKYSLKTRYNFRKVLNEGETFKTSHLIIRYLKVSDDVFKDEPHKKFAIIVSNKFSKKAVVQNRVRRVIGEAIRLNLERFPNNYYYVFIPRKSCLVNEKPNVHTKEISAEIDSFLSKMVVA